MLLAIHIFTILGGLAFVLPTHNHNLQSLSQLAIKADDILVRINATIHISNSQVFALLSTF